MEFDSRDESEHLSDPERIEDPERTRGSCKGPWHLMVFWWKLSRTLAAGVLPCWNIICCRILTPHPSNIFRSLVRKFKSNAALSKPPFTVPPPVLALASKAPADSVIALSTWLVKIATCSPKSQTKEKAGLLQVSHFWWGVFAPSWLVWKFKWNGFVVRWTAHP